MRRTSGTPQQAPEPSNAADGPVSAVCQALPQQLSDQRSGVRLAAQFMTLFAVIALVFGLFVMLLWNWLMPEVFGLRPLTYWQAWGLVLLAHILFAMGVPQNPVMPSNRG